MGTCTSQLSISKDLYLTMKANPNDPKMLLVFQLFIFRISYKNIRKLDFLLD